MNRRAGISLVVAGAAIAGLMAGGISGTAPLFLYNGSSSLPRGWYVRSFDDPETLGEIIAFSVPPGGTAYINASPAMAFYRNGAHPLIKPVVAAAGATICRMGAAFIVNGQTRGAALERDVDGTKLPDWQGCRKLQPGEVAVYSDRITNSFDSRYFAAVPAAGAHTYRPLVTVTER